MNLLKLQELEQGKQYKCGYEDGYTFFQPYRLTNKGNLEFQSPTTKQWFKDNSSDLVKSKYRFKEIKL